MKSVARTMMAVALVILIAGLVGCGKSDAEKKQEAAMEQLAKYKGEDSGDHAVSEDEAKRQVEQSRKEYEEQKKKGAPAGHMSMDEFKKMAESREK